VVGRAAVLVWVAAAAACSDDPSVRVRFEVPEAYRDLVDAVALEVLAPEGGELDCDVVALGNASEQEMASARVAEALVRDDGDDARLSGIPRTGDKLFVARALSATGQLVAGGCAALGTIDGDQEVVIAGEPALTLGARDTPGSGPLPGELTILVSDARGQPVEGVLAEQTVYAAHETALPGPPVTSGRGGALRFQVEQADWAGPQVLDVDVRWQANQRDLLSGFAAPFLRDAVVVPGAAQPEDLASRALYQIGRIGEGGEMGVAVLGRADEDGLRRVHLYLYSGGGFGPPTTTAGQIRADALGLVETGEGDRVIAMNATTWYSIAADGSVDSGPKPDLLDAVALAPIGACTPGAPRDRILAVSASGEVGMYDPLGQRVDDEWVGARPRNAGELMAVGCVRGLEETYRAAVYTVNDGSSPRPLLVLDAAGAEPTPINSAVDRGYAFTPVYDTGEGPFLLANRFETDGNSIARYTALPIDGAPTFLDERDEDEIAGLSTSTVGGDFDEDGRLDVASMVAVPTGDGRVELRFFMALGFVVEEQRLFGQGASGIANPDFRPILYAADFDEDGIDDLLVATTEGFSAFELEPE
jgi:hypothetical protein